MAGYELGPCGGLYVVAPLEAVPLLQPDNTTASSKLSPEETLTSFFVCIFMIQHSIKYFQDTITYNATFVKIYSTNIILMRKLRCELQNLCIKFT
jgi:hypothetical protein